MFNIPLVITLLRVFENASPYFYKWYGNSDREWLKGLKEEVDELSQVIDKKHDHTIEHELIQIAGIATNWLAYLEDIKE